MASSLSVPLSNANIPQQGGWNCHPHLRNYWTNFSEIWRLRCKTKRHQGNWIFFCIGLIQSTWRENWTSFSQKCLIIPVMDLLRIYNLYLKHCWIWDTDRGAIKSTVFWDVTPHSLVEIVWLSGEVMTSNLTVEEWLEQVANWMRWRWTLLECRK
jgi:hypothetical protein